MIIQNHETEIMIHNNDLKSWSIIMMHNDVAMMIQNHETEIMMHNHDLKS
jgi:hypothetical protein